MTKWIRQGAKDCRVYHTDKDCKQLKQAPVKATPNAINAHNMRECKVCAGTVQQGDSSQDHLNALKEAANK